jgi:ABC-type transport system involved in multi-copper enzyme maturation permease subunit
MQRIWSDLVLNNPMLIEVHRFRRRFFSFSGSNTLNGIILGLALVCYAGLLMLVFSARGTIPAIAIVVFQTFLFTLVAPAMLYGSIAGEREKRTWDLLVAAPITQAQIVMGKFIGGLAAIGIGYGLMIFPIMIAAAQYQRTDWYALLVAELNSFTFAVCVAALTLFFSARCRRGFMALGTVLGILAIVLLVCPSVTAAILNEESFIRLVNSFHPFLSETALLSYSETYGYAEQLSPFGWAWFQVVGYVVLSGLFIAWSAKTLNFAENDVKFIPTKSNA